MRLFLLLALIAAPLLPQTTPSHSWNGWLFDPPSGWNTEETPAGYILHPGATAGVNRVILLPPQPVSGGLEQWFPAAMRQQASTFRAFRPGPIKRAKTPQDVPYLYTTAQAINQQGLRVLVSFVGLLSENGQGLLLEAQFDIFGMLRNLRPYGAFIKSIEPGTAPQTAASTQTGRTHPSNRHNAEAAQAPPQPAADLTPVNTTPPAPPTGKDLYDWFGNFRQILMPGANFTLSTQMVWTFYRFFPSGYVYVGLPVGLDPGALNCPALVRGGKCLRYSLSGSTLTIAGEKPHTFATDGTGIKIDGTTYNRVRRAPATLSGTWETSSGGGVLTTVTLSQHRLTLRPDGTFSITGSTGVSAPNAAAYGSSAMSGRYKLSGYTIEMDYTGGRTVRQSFLLPYPDNNVFLIGSAMYFVPDHQSTRRR